MIASKILGRIERLRSDQLKATQDAAYQGMTPNLNKECRERRAEISRLVDRLKECEDRREVVSKLLNRLAGLSD
jgi:hypothetical protein